MHFFSFHVFNTSDDHLVTSIVASLLFSGLEAIFYLTRENRKLSIYMEAHDGESRTANYSNFYIDGADAEYVLHVSNL